MLTRQERRTQKKVLEQRDTARTEVDSLKAENERLRGDVRVLAEAEIRAVERAAKEQVQAALAAKERAEKERAELLADFEGALTRKLEETRKELEQAQIALGQARLALAEERVANKKLTEQLDSTYTEKKLAVATVDGLMKELESLKMEDTKSLRKRLQKKSEQLVEAEQQIAKLKSERVVGANGAVFSKEGLASLLNTQLRRKVEEDGKKAVPAPAEAPAPEATPQP